MTAITEARTVPEVNAAFKATFATIDATDRDAVAALDTELRLWHVRNVVQRDGIPWTDMNAEQRRVCPERRPGTATATKAKGVPLFEQRATAVNDDGTITCAGPCGQAKPTKKFPTLKGGIGRGNTCRECRDAAIAARRNGSGS